MLYSLFAGFRVLLHFPQAWLRWIFYTRIRGMGEREALLKLGRLFSEAMLRLARADLVIEGRDQLAALPAGRRVVIIANHESVLDIPCIIGAMPFPVAFIAKRELARIPMLGYWIKKLGGVLLNREDRRASLLSLGGIFDGVKGALLVFPEGTRNREGTVGSFKPGSLRLALDNDAILLPVAMAGGRRIFEGNRFRSRPGTIFLRILEPLDTRGLTVEHKTAFATKLRERVLAVHRELKSKSESA